MNIEKLKAHVKNLKPYRLQTSKCTSQTSFHRQIFENIKGSKFKSQKRQEKQFFFNLGNGQKFSNPLDAADYLLQREFSRTFLFNHTKYKENIFIPAVFVSKLYHNKISYLDHKIEETLRTSEKNRSVNQPNDWFTKQLSAFIKKNPEKISNSVYCEWITKVKCLFFILKQFPGSKTKNLPSIENMPEGIRDFVQQCSHEVSLIDGKHYLVREFKKIATKKDFHKYLKLFLMKELQKTSTPRNDPIFNWCFYLNMTEVSGEIPEFWFFESLHDILSDEKDDDVQFEIEGTSPSQEIYDDDSGPYVEIKTSDENYQDFLDLFSGEMDYGRLVKIMKDSKEDIQVPSDDSQQDTLLGAVGQASDTELSTEAQDVAILKALGLKDQNAQNDEKLLDLIGDEIDSGFIPSNDNQDYKTLLETIIHEELEQSRRTESMHQNEFEHMVVLHACDIALDVSTNSDRQEFDFLIFVPLRKIIIGVEVKNTITGEGSFKQLDRYRETLEERLGDQLGDGWTFYPAVFVYQPTTEMLDGTISSQHLIHSETDIKKWLCAVLENFPLQPQEMMEKSVSQLCSVLKVLVFVLQMSKSSLPHAGRDNEELFGLVTQSKWVKFVTEAIKTVSTTNNIIFYSKTQLPIFLSDALNCEKVVIKGCFGSGKTFLLREKAKLLADYGEKCVYIFGKTNYDKKPLLQIQLEEDWKRYSTIRIVNLKDILNGSSIERNPETLTYDDWQAMCLLEFAKNTDEHIFLDEMDVSPKDERMEELANLKNRFVWIACHFSLAHELIGWNGKFYVVDLPYTMRNSRNITNFAEKVKQREMFVAVLYAVIKCAAPENFPSGLMPKRCVTLKESLTELNFPTVKSILIVVSNGDDKSFIKIMETLKNIDNSCKIGAYKIGRKTVGYSCIEPTQCLSVLKEGVLVIDREAVEGFEWPVMLVVNPNRMESYDLIMRCVTHLIICQDESLRT